MIGVTTDYHRLLALPRFAVTLTDDITTSAPRRPE
jgi:hypothetical protein